MWLWYGTFLDKYQYGMWPTARTKLDASVVYSDTLLLDSYWCILHSALTPILAAIKLLMRKQEDPDSRCKWAGGWGEPSAICQAHLVYRALCKVQLSPDKPQTPPPPSSSSPPVELTVCHFHHMERNHGTFVKVESRLCGGDEEHEGGGQEREGQRCKIREGIVRDINLMQAWAEEGERWRDIMSHKLNLLNQNGKHKVQSNKADRQVRICNQPSTLQVG